MQLEVIAVTMTELRSLQSQQLRCSHCQTTKQSVCLPVCLSLRLWHGCSANVVPMQPRCGKVNRGWLAQSEVVAVTMTVMRSLVQLEAVAVTTTAVRSLQNAVSVCMSVCFSVLSVCLSVCFLSCGANNPTNPTNPMTAMRSLQSQ